MLATSKAKLSFRAVEVFVAVVEERAVISAAKRLGASPSAVSLQLSNLEKALGAKLIERSSQRFALTHAGEIFLPRAIRIMDEVSSASAALANSSASPRMLLKLAMIEDFDAFVLPFWLSAIKSRSPNIRFHVKSGPSHESYTALENRSADIIVAVDTTDTTDWVESYPILQDPYILVKSSRIRSATAMEDLMRFPFVRYSREQHMGRQIEAQLRRTGSTPAREHEFSSNQGVFSMVEETNGWTITSVSAFASVWFAHQGKNNTPNLIASALPIPSFSRHLSLYARKEALGDLPATLAGELRSTLERHFVGPLMQDPALSGVASGFHVLNTGWKTED